MIKASLPTLLPVYHKLFNTVLNLGSVPKNWCSGLITPIFKSGVRNDPSNVTVKKYTLVLWTLEKPLTQSGMMDFYIDYYKLV